MGQSAVGDVGKRLEMRRRERERKEGVYVCPGGVADKGNGANGGGISMAVICG